VSYEFIAARGGDRTIVRAKGRSGFELPLGANEVAKAEVTDMAAADLLVLGMSGPDSQFEPQIEVHELMALDSDSAKETPRKLAYKAFVEFTFRGRRVEGPKAVLSYYLDGTLHKAALSRPTLSPGAHVGGPVDLEFVVGRVEAELAGHALESQVPALEVREEYLIADGRLSPTLVFRGKLYSGMDDGSYRWGELVVPLQEGVSTE
jgi:hypothetical protein